MEESSGNHAMERSKPGKIKAGKEIAMDSSGSHAC